MTETSDNFDILCCTDQRTKRKGVGSKFQYHDA